MRWSRAWYNGFDAEPEAVQAFAWSAPMRDLAKLIGISDVALRKQFNRVGIVTPPQGHWTRIAAGREGHIMPGIRPRRPGETGRVKLDERFAGHVPAAPEWPTYGPLASAAVPEDLEELRDRELRAIGRVKAPRDLSRAAAGLSALLRREEEIRRKAATDRFAWRRPHFDGPLEQRKLRILSALFHALVKRGHEGDAYEREGEIEARCIIGDSYLPLKFGIVGKHRTEMRSGTMRAAADLPASTPLRLSIGGWSRGEDPVSWEDGEAGKLESRLGEIAAALVVEGEASFRKGLVMRAERREQERLRKEEEHRRHIVALEAKRIEDLKASGLLLSQANELRALVAKVKDAVAGGGLEAGHADVGRWERWALEQADRLDPVKSGQVLAHLHVPELDDVETD